MNRLLPRLSFSIVQPVADRPDFRCRQVWVSKIRSACCYDEQKEIQYGIVPKRLLVWPVPTRRCLWLLHGLLVKGLNEQLII